MKRFIVFWFALAMMVFMTACGTKSTAKDAITYRDYPVILGFTIWMCIIYVVVNTAIDIVVAAIDPRVRKSIGGNR